MRLIHVSLAAVMIGAVLYVGLRDAPDATAQQRLISTPSFSGWRHSGAGSFDAKTRDGKTIYVTRGGLGLLWWEEELANFEVSFDFQVGRSGGNSGIFLRVPDPDDDAYIYRSFEVQIDPRGLGTSATGAIYSVQPPLVPVIPQPGEWHRMVITAVGEEIEVRIDDLLVNVFRTRAGGQVESFTLKGYLGLQNHSAQDVVRFRDIRLRPL